MEHYTFARFIVDEGASTSILSVHAWRGMGSPILVPTANQPLSFDRSPS